MLFKKKSFIKLNTKKKIITSSIKGIVILIRNNKLKNYYF